MRIAIFVYKFPCVSETFILRQITGLLDLGHEVDILSERCPDEDQTSVVHDDVAKYNLLDRTTYLDREMPLASGYWSMPVVPIAGETWLPGAERSIKNIDRILEAIPAIRRCLEEVPELTIRVADPSQFGHQAITLETLYHLVSLLARRSRYDVAHAHFGPTANAFRFVRELWNVPFVVSFHGYDFTTVPRVEGQDVYRALFETVDAAIANSDYTLERVRQLGCPIEKLRRIPVGLDPAQFSLVQRRWTPGTPIGLLMVARLVEIKGHEYAIRAVSELRTKGTDARLDIIGDGHLKVKLQTLIEQLGLTQYVTLHGAKSTNVVRHMMEQAHIFIMASVNVDGDEEGQGLAIQEAQACGLPVVATNHGAFPEGLLNGRSGFLVPERDAHAIAERITYLVEHCKEWEQIGKCGRQYVEANYDIAHLNARLVTLYKDVIRSHQASMCGRSSCDVTT